MELRRPASVIPTVIDSTVLRLPDDVSEEDWNALAATMLNEAGFEPAKTKDLNELAVWFAKGLASLEVRGRI